MTQQNINNAIVLYRLSVSRDEVKKADEIFFTAPELQEVLESPIVSQKKKDAVIDKVYSDAGISATIIRYLKMMCKLGYADSMRATFDAYYKYDDEKNLILKAQLISADNPTDESIRSAENMLQNKYPSYKIELTKEVDPSLLGGYKIVVGHKEYDKSYSGMLDQLERKLTGR